MSKSRTQPGTSQVYTSTQSYAITTMQSQSLIAICLAGFFFTFNMFMKINDLKIISNNQGL